jgi:putative DNA primase/helicase
VRVKADACDANEARASIVVEFQTRTGRFKQEVIERRALLGSGSKVVADLVAAGLELADRKKAPNLLLDCLSEWVSEKQLRLADGFGWQEGSNTYVLPNGRVIGDEVVLPKALVPCAAPKGTLAGWRDDVSRFCIGNPDLILAVSASFASCLLRPLNENSGGLHFHGQSSSGKTSLLVTAASVWSDPATLGSWRTTDNALERQAAVHNDRALLLDEFAQIDANAANRALYMLGNARGKERHASQGLRWTVMTLSTGEITASQKLAEAGKIQMDGQAVRMLDIPVGDQAFGVFDQLHDAPDGRSFSDRLRTNAAEHYGTAGPALVEGFLADRTAAMEKLAASIAAFHAEAERLGPDTGDGLQGRARTCFAVIAAAGEFASAQGITGWPLGTAWQAALKRFHAWCASIGPGPQARAKAAAEAAERHARDAALEQVRLLLLSHHKRVIDLDCTAETRPADPVAWKKGGFFYVPGPVWERIHDDPIRATALLLKSGHLLRGDGANMRAKVPTGVTGPSRAYKIRADIMP